MQQSPKPYNAIDKIVWNQLHIRLAFQAIRSIDHKLRQRIIDMINDFGHITVTDLYVKLRIDQSVCSQQIAILRRGGIVHAKRDGKFIFYSLDYDRIDQIKAAVENFVKK